MRAPLLAEAAPAPPPAAGAARPAGRRLPTGLLPVGWLLLLCLAAFASLLLPGPWPRQFVVAGDFSRQFYPFHVYAAARLASGQLPLWDPYLFGGQAHLADPQTALFYPPGLLIDLLAGRQGLPYVALEWRAALDLALGALFCYLLVARLARSRTGGVVGATVFCFGGYLASYPLPQLPVLEASVWLPLLLYALERGLAGRAVQARGTGWFVLAGLAGAILLSAGHGQTALYAAYAAGGYALMRWYALRRSPLPTAAQLLLAGLLAAGLSAPQWLPTLEYLPATNRAALGYAAASGGFAPADLAQLVLPGGYFLRSFYVGILPLLLALLALRRRAAWGWALLWLLAALAALGRNGPLYPLLYAHAPGFAAFRDQERAAYLATLAAAVLTGCGAAQVLGWARRRQGPAGDCRAVGLPEGGGAGGRQAAGAPSGHVGRGLSVPALASASAALARPADGPSPAARPGHGGAGRGGAAELAAAAAAVALTVGGAVLLRLGAPPAENPALTAPLGQNLAAAGLLGAAALLTLVAAARGRLRPATAAGLLCLLPAINLLGADGGLGRTAADPLPPLPRAAAAYVRAQPGLFRVDTLRQDELTPNAGALLGLSFPRGDDPIVIRRSAELAGQPNRYPVWRLFNVQYLLSRQDPGTGFARVAQGDGFAVYHMLYPLPRAWAVREIHQAAAPEAALRETLALPQPGAAAVLEAQLGLAIAGPALPRDQRETWLEVSPERLRLNAMVTDNALLVISQPAAPGWRATLDGRPAALLPADYAFVALALPAGDHRVTLEYRPPGLTAGAAAATLAALLGGAALIWMAVTALRPRRASPLPPPRRGEQNAAGRSGGDTSGHRR